MRLDLGLDLEGTADSRHRAAGSRLGSLDHHRSLRPDRRSDLGRAGSDTADLGSLEPGRLGSEHSPGDLEIEL